MRVLLTGATGFVGRNLLPMLAAAGHEIVAAGRQDSSPSPLIREWVCWDLSSPASPARLPKADAVIHLAQPALSFPDHAAEIHAVSATATLQLLEHVRECDAQRFVLASTGNVYGFSGRPFTESDPQRPAGFYAAVKCHAEHLAESYQPWIRTAILRLFAPYGPGQTGRMIPDIIARVRESRPVILKSGGQPRLTPICIADACRLIVRSLSADSHIKVNIAGDEHAGVRDIARIAGEILGVEPVFENSAEPGPGDLMGDNRLMKTILGAEPLLPLREGLRQTIQG